MTWLLKSDQTVGLGLAICQRVCEKSPCVHLEGQVKDKTLNSTKQKAPFGANLLIELEARAGVEPTYTDLQSGA